MGSFAFRPRAPGEVLQKVALGQNEGFQRYKSLVWMILAWTSGMTLAIGHHVFYARIDGSRVIETPLKQIWIIRIATGLAFFIQTLFVISAGIAYTQLQWLTTRSKPFKIRQIDSITNIQGNPLEFFRTRTWLRYPTLLLLASITWLLPIAAIFTPATLTVVSYHDTQSQASSTPRQLYYNPHRFGNLEVLEQNGYLGPALDTLRTAYGSAMTGQVLAIPAAHSNMSYSLNFNGPALRCDPADASLIREVYNAYLSQLTGSAETYHYIAWVPTSEGRVNFTTSNITLDVVSKDTAHLYIIPNTTAVAGPVIVNGVQQTPEDEQYGYQNLLDCKLYNASYSAIFNFSYPSQSIQVRHRELLNPVNASTDISEWYRGLNESQDVSKQAETICYQSIMDCLGRLLVGYKWRHNVHRRTVSSSWNMMLIDWTTRSSAKLGVEQLFQNITLSMFSTRPLTMNRTIAAQNPVPVEIHTNYNIYSYDPSDLWLAYGLAAGSALFCVLFGLHAAWYNGATYTNVFSTFLRATRDQALQHSISLLDDGADPLPDDLAEVSITLARGGYMSMQTSQRSLLEVDAKSVSSSINTKAFDRLAPEKVRDHSPMELSGSEGDTLARRTGSLSDDLWVASYEKRRERKNSRNY